MALQEMKQLKKFNWKIIIVDEAHRLKNKESKLYGEMNWLKTDFKLLLTVFIVENFIGNSFIKFID
jgi:SNF2 family DNA or RNA helicase